MNGLGEGVGFAGLAIAAAWVDAAGGDAFWLWLVLFFWACFSDWGQKSAKAKP